MTYLSKSFSLLLILLYCSSLSLNKKKRVGVKKNVDYQKFYHLYCIDPNLEFMPLTPLNIKLKKIRWIFISSLIASQIFMCFHYTLIFNYNYILINLFLNLLLISALEMMMKTKLDIFGACPKYFYFPVNDIKEKFGKTKY